MKVHLSNASWGVLDYAAYPAAMLVSAPTLLHHLGATQYGIWIVCTAAISTGGIIAAGFGDANIQHVATSRNNATRVHDTVRSLMGINTALGLVVTIAALFAAQGFARHIVPAASPLYLSCVISLSLAAVLMLVRALESVCVSTQRAFERYGKAVEVSIAARVLSIAAAVVLAHTGHGIASIMLATFAFTTLGTVIQFAQLKRLLHAPSLSPRFHRSTFRSLFGYGIFSWLQAVSTVIFSQADRLFLGAALGATAVTSYALCVQIAQPIYGISAAGLHFLFPYLASRATKTTAHLRRAVALAFMLNLAFVSIAGTIAIAVAPAFMRHWVGNAIAAQAETIYIPIILGFALLSLSVPAYYALLAFGRVRAVTFITLTGSAAMLLLFKNLSTFGVRGVTFARFAFCLISLGLYVPLFRVLRTRATPASTLALPLQPTGEQA